MPLHYIQKAIKSARKSFSRHVLGLDVSPGSDVAKNLDLDNDDSTDEQRRSLDRNPKRARLPSSASDLFSVRGVLNAVGRAFDDGDEERDAKRRKKFDLRAVNDPKELNDDEPGEDADSLGSGSLDFEDDEELDYLERKDTYEWQADAEAVVASVDDLDTSKIDEDELGTLKTGDAQDARVARKDPFVQRGPEDDLVEDDKDRDEEGEDEDIGEEKDERIFGKTIQGMEDSDGEEGGASEEELDSDPECPRSRIQDTSNIRDVQAGCVRVTLGDGEFVDAVLDGDDESDYVVAGVEIEDTPQTNRTRLSRHDSEAPTEQSLFNSTVGSPDSKSSASEDPEDRPFTEMYDTSWRNTAIEEQDVSDLPSRDPDEISYEDEEFPMSAQPLPSERCMQPIQPKGDFDEPTQPESTTTVSDRHSELSAGLRAVTKDIPLQSDSMASEQSIPTPSKRRDLVQQLAHCPKEAFLETDESPEDSDASYPAAIKRAASVKSTGSAMIDTAQITRLQEQERWEQQQRESRRASY